MKLWKKIGLGLGALVAAPFLAPVLAGLGGAGLGALGLGAGTMGAGAAGGLAAGATAAGAGAGIGAAAGAAAAPTLAGVVSSLPAAAVAAAPKALATAGAKVAAPKVFEKLGIHGKGADMLQRAILPGLVGYASGGLQGALGMPLLAAQMGRNGQSSAMPMLGGLVGRALGGKSGGLAGMGMLGLLPSLLDPMPKEPELGAPLNPEDLMANLKPTGVDDIFGNPLTRGQPTLDSLFGKSF